MVYFIDNGFHGNIYYKDGVAIKICRSRHSKGFINEYWNLRSLNQLLPDHPHLIRVFEYFKDGSFSMEYLHEYVPLTTKFMRTLSYKDRQRIYEKVQKTICDLHHVEYTHGDIRNSRNVMYHPYNKDVKVIDFGYSQHVDYNDMEKARKALCIDYLDLEKLKVKLLSWS